MGSGRPQAAVGEWTVQL